MKHEAGVVLKSEATKDLLSLGSAQEAGPLPQTLPLPLRMSLVQSLPGHREGSDTRMQDGERGSALVEFSLFLPFFLLMLLGVTDIGLGIQKAMIVQQAAHAGAMCATLSGKDTVAAMQTAANNAAAAGGIASLTVTPQFLCASSPTGTRTIATPPCPASAPMEWASVATSYNYSALFGYPGLPGSFALTGFSEIRVK